MKRLIYAICAAAAALTLLCSCEKKWESDIVLGVTDTRLNVSKTSEGWFMLAVYSNRSWTMKIVQGSDWLHCADDAVEYAGKGREYVKMTHLPNEDNDVRVAKVLLTAGDNKLTVNVVQDGKVNKAKNIDDVDL